MPSYFYHLKFELYPSPPPEPHKGIKADAEGEIWLPPAGSNIFDTNTWPRHQRVLEDQKAEEVQLDRKEYEYLTGKSKADSFPGGGGAVIDCGPSRAADTRNAEEGDTETILPIRSTTTRLDWPPPNPSLEARDLRVAAKDWRFGRVRVESVDTTEMDGRPRVRRGESSMSIADGGSGITANLADGSGLGRITKARFEELEGKNTEVGWGVVHLYRDGEETPGLNGVGGDAQSYGATTAGGGTLGAVKEEEKEEDCTTLCIPAVPSYLSPSDFLGFVGEKTREQVSHFRMVMTGRMNRYLVLMKFRDSGAARRWKAEWDGTVFNSVEVRSHSPSLQFRANSHLTARSLPRRIHKVDHLPNTHAHQLTHQRLLPRALPRSLHPLPRIIHLPQALPTTYTLARRTSHLPCLPRAYG